MNETKNNNSVEPETVETKKIDLRPLNLKMFKPADERTPEETERLREISRKGGLARQQQAKRRKNMQEVTKELLYSALSRDKAEELLGEGANLIADEDLTVMSVLTLRMMQEVAQGNTRAYEAIRDTAGFSPKKEIELQADIMTDADRSLIDKISRRLGESG